jgi:hypothetical protein
MHGAAHITPEVGLVLAFGLALFIVIYRQIFRNPKK